MGQTREEASRQKGVTGNWGDLTSQMQGRVSTQILAKDADTAQTMGDAITHEVSGGHSRRAVSGG